MAEGDSVFRMARLVEAAFDGREVVSAPAPNARSPLRQTASRLAGRELEDARSQGKHLIFDFSGGLSLHAHMGMSGGWYVYAPGQAWKRQRRSAWLVMDLGDREVVQFGGPTMRLVRKAELGRDSRLALLGPDLLDPGFTPETGAIAIETAGTVELGEALLDQRNLAGIGAIYCCESLFLCGVSPFTPVGQVPDLSGLVTTAHRLLMRNAPRTSRSTTGDERRPYYVYSRRRQPCRRCGTLIESGEQGRAPRARVMYWCPRCQARGA